METMLSVLCRSFQSYFYAYASINVHLIVKNEWYHYIHDSALTFAKKKVIGERNMNI
jgi:hypothetical protein